MPELGDDHADEDEGCRVSSFVVGPWGIAYCPYCLGLVCVGCTAHNEGRPVIHHPIEYLSQGAKHGAVGCLILLEDLDLETQAQQIATRLGWLSVGAELTETAERLLREGNGAH